VEGCEKRISELTVRWNGERGYQHSLGGKMEAGDVSSHYVGLVGKVYQHSL